MQYRTLGRTGIQVSPFALGAMMLGTDGRIGNGDEQDSIRIVHRALDAGINIIDTATATRRAGPRSSSEGDQGPARRRRPRHEVQRTDGGRPEPPRQLPRWITTAVEDSLRRLQTDHIDLYQAHRPDDTVDLEETLSALTDLVRSGKVRAIGSSDFPASMQVEAQWTSERRGLERFRSEQPTYSILSRGIEREVLPVAQRHGMGTLVWSPLAGGMLTGRFRRGQQNDLSRAGMFRHDQDDRRIDAVEQVVALAEETGIPTTHLALAFAIAHPGVTSALIGPRSVEQLDDLLAAADVALSDEVLDRIDAIVPPGTDVTRLDQQYQPPALLRPELRRRPAAERSAA